MVISDKFINVLSAVHKINYWFKDVRKSLKIYNWTFG